MAGATGIIGEWLSKGWVRDLKILWNCSKITVVRIEIPHSLLCVGEAVLRWFLHWTSGSWSGLVAMCCSYYDYQSNEMRKMFGHGVLNIKMTALSRVTSWFPTETESREPSVANRQSWKPAKRGQTTSCHWNRSQFLVTTKGFKNFRRVANNWKLL